jgi:hypothetical protein
MWSGGSGSGESFEGRRVTATRLLNSPQAISRPRVPIMIGGGGEQKTLRLVAQYADACNLFAGDIDQVRHKLEVLQGHCDALGRDYDAIEKTILTGTDPSQDLDGFLREMEAYAALGIGLVGFMPPTPDPVAFTTMLVSDVLPRLADI